MLAVIWQEPDAGDKKKSKKQGKKKFDGLASKRPDPGRRVPSTRYTTEPHKAEDRKSDYAPMKAGSGNNARASATSHKEDEDMDELQMPVVGEDEYLLPQSGAAATAYVDFAPDNVNGINSFHFCYIILYAIIIYTTAS